MRIALFQPDIPQNTGNIFRLAACLGLEVDIIEPAGFLFDNKKLETINLFEEKDLNLILVNLKTTYENYWKNINQINTSIKLPLTISIDATQHKKIQTFENGLSELDLVSNFEILNR